jgi:hypothetical protein
MAQVGFTPLLLYVNSTTSTAPTSGNLATGELALNSFSGKLYYKTPAGVVTVLADAGTSAGVTTFSGGTTGFTPSTATNGAVTLAGTLITVNGGTGISSYAVGDLLFANTTTTLDKLARGANGFVLTSNGTAPAYVAQSTLSVGSATTATTATNIAAGAAGAIPFQTAAATTSMLTIGAAYSVVASNAGATAPTYQTLSSLIDNAFAGSAQGTVLYRGASSWSALGPGVSGYVLQTGGAAADPSWVNPTATAGVTTFSGGTSGLTPSTATSGAITLAGTLVAANGGTSFSTYAAGDIIYASATNTLSKLTIGSSSQVLTVVAGVPAWSASSVGVSTFSGGTTGLTPNTATTGAITLAGTLIVGNGGTGLTTLVANYIPYGAGTSAFGSSASLQFDGTSLGVGVSPAATRGVIQVGPTNIGFTSANALLAGAQSANAGIQHILQNTNAGVSASASYWVANNNGTASTNYGKFSMNSSGYTGAGSLNLASAVSLTSASGDLVLGTITSNSIRFVTAASATDAITIDTTNAVAFNGQFGTAGQFLRSAGTSAPPTWAGVTLGANATVTGLTETTNVVAAAPSTTQNIDVTTSTVWYYTANTSANWVLNIRSTSLISLNTMMAVGTSITVVFAATNSTTAYYQTAIQIDGLTQTVRYQGGSAPTAGNVSSVDIYTVTIFKTAATPTYSVFASQVRFA